MWLLVGFLSRAPVDEPITVHIQTTLTRLGGLFLKGGEGHEVGESSLIGMRELERETEVNIITFHYISA